MSANRKAREEKVDSKRNQAKILIKEIESKLGSVKDLDQMNHILSGLTKIYLNNI
jgi:uncharacterized membrane protein